MNFSRLVFLYVLISLAVFTVGVSYFYAFPADVSCASSDTHAPKINNSCYPQEDEILSAPFVAPSPLCGPYRLPPMPDDIASMVLGVDLPALAPPDKINHTIIWDILMVRQIINHYGDWENRYKLCTVPSTYQALIEAVFSYLPKDWKLQTKNKVPCDLVFINAGAFQSTHGVCKNLCYRTQPEVGGSLAVLPYMPSIVIQAYKWFSPRFIWMLTRYRSSKSLWVLEMNGESVGYYPMATHPFFKSMANISVGHSRKYFDVPYIPRIYTFEEQLRNPPPLIPLSQRNSSALIFWLQSNCQSKSYRDIIAKELMKYIDIDSYGACLNNKAIPEWAQTKYGSYYSDIKRALLETYPFVLSMENSIITDYITEKFWQPLAFGSIPIYLGPENMADFIPAEYDPDNPTYINLQDWESLENLAFYLKALAANETMWNRYHKWRQIPQKEREEKSFLKWLDEQKEIEQLTCAYCKYIYEGWDAVKWPNLTVYTPSPCDSHPIIKL